MSKDPKNTLIPTRLIGPIKIVSSSFTKKKQTEEVTVPLATFETPLWPSVMRGSKLSCLTDGIKVEVINDGMTRSVVLESPNLAEAKKVITEFAKHSKQISALVRKTSKFCELLDWSWELVGNLIYFRFAFFTGDAAGHNMTTNATDAILRWLLARFTQLKYVSISANYCTDKKVSAVNGILGRGKYVVAEIQISRAICRKILRTTPEALVNINIKKNLLGSILAGSIRSANAHYANMLLAFYLATGQDASNIIEGSQGITHVEVRNNQLYFSVTLPNLILGTAGSGKNSPGIQYQLKKLGCLEKRATGQNSIRLAIIAAATVLCGELSLLAALTIPGELTRAHLSMERKKTSKHC